MATDSQQLQPETFPITNSQYRLLVDQGTFDRSVGQIELINGRLVRRNPQGPLHPDPLDELTRWSFEVAVERFRIRIEKPIELPELNSSPEPDIVWADRRRYADRHPVAGEVQLLIEVSHRSKQFDRGEKLQLYARANIREYWLVDVRTRTVEVFADPESGDFQSASVFSISDTIRPGCLATAELEIATLFSDSI